MASRVSWDTVAPRRSASCRSRASSSSGSFTVVRFMYASIPPGWQPLIRSPSPCAPKQPGLDWATTRDFVLMPLGPRHAIPARASNVPHRPSRFRGTTPVRPRSSPFEAPPTSKEAVGGQSPPQRYGRHSAALTGLAGAPEIVTDQGFYVGLDGIEPSTSALSVLTECLVFWLVLPPTCLFAPSQSLERRLVPLRLGTPWARVLPQKTRGSVS